MASVPVLSVWPMICTVVAGLATSVCAKRSRIGWKLGRMAALLTRNEMSLGMSSCSRFSRVCVTCTPVPAVASSMARFCSSIWRDQM